MTVKDLKDYKGNLTASLTRNLSEFEKNFLLIAGGILAFSISFIKEIVKIESATNLFLLYISWVLIIASIALMMIAFLKSSSASDELWRLVEEFMLSNKLFKDEELLSEEQTITIKTITNTALYKSKKELKNQRNWAVKCFILGVVSLALYVSINLSHENKKSLVQKLDNKVINDTIQIDSNSKSINVIIKHGKKENDTTITCIKTSDNNRKR